MSLPTLEQYNEAIQHPASAFYDPELKGSQIKKTGLGLPFAISGGFALTYTATCGKNKYAIRCFHKEAPDLETRYAAISRKLKQLNSPYFIDFSFQKQGIKVRGADYPVVKMAWAKGKTLGEFVEANYKDKEKIGTLKNSIVNLASFLEKNRISHGDIQPGNLMVDESGQNLQLIDYDGMYLPELAHLTSNETGLRSFQHPERWSDNPWNENLDRFSFILLYLALTALESDPSFWTSSQSDGDKFLFGPNDLVDPDSSRIFSQLSGLTALKDWIPAFATICKTDFIFIPSLNDFVFASIDLSGLVSDAPLQLGAGRRAYISSYPVLDAKDYELCLAHVGDMVELVGRVEQVKYGLTRYNAPYYFINFSDWRGKAVKISVWPSYLKGHDRDFKKLQGKYVSVTGLLEPPFENVSGKHRYSHLSISLDSRTSFNEIDAKEAAFRLGKTTDNPKQGANQTESGSDTENKKIIECPACGKEMEIPTKGHLLNIACPVCRLVFSYDNSTDTAAIAQEAQKERKTSHNRDILEKIRTEAASVSKNSGADKKIIACPQCGKKLRIPAYGAVTGINCPACKAIFNYNNADERCHFAPENQTRPPNQDILEKIRQVGRVHAAQKSGPVIIKCPKCARSLRLPGQKIVDACCPSCKTEFRFNGATGEIEYGSEE